MKDILKPNHHYFYLPKVIILVQTGLKYSAGKYLATPPNSEIIYVQNVGAKVEMVSYLKK